MTILSPTRHGVLWNSHAIWASDSTRARRTRLRANTPTNRTGPAPSHCDDGCRRPASIWQTPPTLRSVTRQPYCTGTIFVREVRRPGERWLTIGIARFWIVFAGAAFGHEATRPTPSIQ